MDYYNLKISLKVNFMLRKLFAYLFIVTFLFIGDPSAQVIGSEPSSDEVVSYSFKIELPQGIQEIEIHGQRRFLNLSQMVKQVLQTSGLKVFDYFGYITKGTLHINLDEKATLANGSATVFPNTIINLFLMQALGSELLTSDYNYIEGLVLHELTHILQLDQTRGFLGVLEMLFGSYGKLGVLTPRWFIEGIGVWAETKFTDGGRLRNPMMTAMLYKNILDPSFCQTIACFDQPGEYPNGSYAYWMGGHFIDYIENIRPGSIRCLIEANSRKFPFFLNMSFRECTGKNAGQHYRDYRKILVKKAGDFKQSLKEKTFFTKMDKVNNVYDSIILSKNFHIQNNTFYKMELSDDEERLVGLNLLTKKTIEYKSKNRIEQLLPPTKQDRMDHTIPISGYPYLSMEVRRDITKISGHSGNEKSITHGASAQYSFSVDANQNIFLKFDGLNWRLYNGKDESYTFSPFLSLYHPRLIGDYLYFQSFYHSQNSTLFQFERINIKRNNSAPETLISSKKPFSFLANDDDSFVFTQNNYFWLLDLKKMVQSLIPSDYVKEIAAMRFDQKDAVVLFIQSPEQFYHYKGNIKELIISLKSKKDKIISNEIILIKKNRQKHILKNIEKSNIESYPKLSHFSPHAWLFGIFSSSANYSFLTAKTHLADPRGHHDIGIGLKYYYERSKPAANLSYEYMPNDFTLFTAYDKSYLQTKFSTIDVVEEEIIVGAGYKFDDQRLTLFPRIYFSKEDKLDFFSKKKNTAYNLSLEMQMARVNSDDFFQFFTSDILFSKQKPKKYKKFDKLDIHLTSKFRLNYSLKFILKASYGKLFKKDLKSGVIFSGGAQGRHPFFGLSSSDSYGNEVATARGEFNFTIFRPYTGSNFFPAYLKEFQFILGEEVINADKIIYFNQLYTNQNLLGTFIGVKTKMNLFYHAPVDMDFILTKIKAPQGGKGGYEFAIRLLAGGF